MDSFPRSPHICDIGRFTADSRAHLLLEILKCTGLSTASLFGTIFKPNWRSLLAGMAVGKTACLLV